MKALRSSAEPCSTGSVAASTASMAALGATGPLGCLPTEARALSNRPAGMDALSMTMAPTRRGGLPTCSRAKATASATTSPSATLSTIPMALALAASMKAPVVIICSACSTPTRRGSRWVPPAPGRMPSVISGSPSWRTSLATTR